MKKTLLSRALENAGMPETFLDGTKESFALSFGFADEVTPAKILDGFRKDHEQLVFLGGMVGGTAYSAQEIQTLAKLPSRQELLAKIVGTLSAPMRGFVTVATGPARGFAQVLRARSESAS